MVSERLIVPLAALCVTGAALRWAAAAPKPLPKGPPAPDAAGPPTTLSSVPRLARVRIDVSPGGAAVQHDLVFPAGALSVTGAGDPTLFAAFTAQQRPLAIEATRHTLDGDALVEPGTKLETISVNLRPKTAALVLGSAMQAGHVIRLPKPGAERFAVRVRSAVATAASTKTITLLARLGVRDGPSIPVDRIEVAAMLGAKVRGARATFCGPSGEGVPLYVWFPGHPASPDAGTTDPASAMRGPADDLCIDVLL